MRNYDRKLTQEEAIKLRELYGTGYYTIKGLAEMYNISATTADHIIKGERYAPFTGGGRVELPEGKHKYKRQSPKGSDHPLHILTEEDVMEIRYIIAKGCLRGQKMKLYREIAKKYFVTPETIASISASHTWKHLPSVKEMRGEA